MITSRITYHDHKSDDEPGGWLLEWAGDGDIAGHQNGSLLLSEAEKDDFRDSLAGAVAP